MDTDTITELLAEAAELVQMFEYQEAVQKFYEAHQLEPENTTVLDQLAEVLLEIGQVDDAQHISNEPHTDQPLSTSFAPSFPPLTAHLLPPFAYLIVPYALFTRFST